MSEKTVESVHTETGFCETFAELDLAFILIGRVLPTDLTAIHHNLFIIYFSQQISSQSKKDRIDYDWMDWISVISWIQWWFKLKLLIF